MRKEQKVEISEEIRGAVAIHELEGHIRRIKNEVDLRRLFSIRVYFSHIEMEEFSGEKTYIPEMTEITVEGVREESGPFEVEEVNDDKAE